MALAGKREGENLLHVRRIDPDAAQGFISLSFRTNAADTPWRMLGAMFPPPGRP